MTFLGLNEEFYNFPKVTKTLNHSNPLRFKMSSSNIQSAGD